MGSPADLDTPEEQAVFSQTGANSRKGRGYIRLWIADATPSHLQEVPDFELGKYEVTATEFCEFLNAMTAIGESPTSYLVEYPRLSTMENVNNNYRPRAGYEFAPAINVSHIGAKKYCEWLSKNTGSRIRLPTEVEWEFAARGKENRLYPWGTESPAGRAYLMGKRGSKPYVRVGSFPSGCTPEGVHDLVGNAPEWCSNYYYEYNLNGIPLDEEYLDFAWAKTRNYVISFNPDHGPSKFKNSEQGFLLLHSYRGSPYLTNGVIAQPWMRFSSHCDFPDAGVGFRILKEL